MSPGRYSILLCRSRNTKCQSLDEKLPAEVPSASGSGVIRAPDFKIRGRNRPKFLRAVAKKYNILNTKSLVAAYNATTDVNERSVLFEWLRKYGERSADCIKPKTVLEYAELAKVAKVSEQDGNVLRELVKALGSQIRPSEFLEENVAKALYIALTWVDSGVYDDTSRLTDLGLDLLNSLSSRPRLKKENFLKYEAHFLCIHQVFFLLQSIGRGNLLEQEKNTLRQVVALKREAMRLSRMYYPVSFHFDLIQQGVERLEIKDDPSDLTKAKRYAASGLYGLMHAFHILRKLAGGDIDPESMEVAYRKARAAIANAGVLEREWYDILQILTAARLRALKEEKKCELLALACNAAIEGQLKTRREKEQKALRFGIVQELRLLASDKDSTCDVRREATVKLVELATNQAISENWIRDADILITILDALHIIRAIDEQNQEISEALPKIQQSCDERTRATFRSWLDGHTMEGQEDTDDEHEDLLAKTGAAIGYRHPCTVRSSIEDLKRTYLRDIFATVSASSVLFGSNINRIHVEGAFLV